MPRKIDDFQVPCEDSKGCPSPADETIPERVGEAAETREGLVDLRSAEQVNALGHELGGRKAPQKGDFAGHWSFAIGSVA